MNNASNPSLVQTDPPWPVPTEMPERILKKIRHATIAGIVSGTLTLLFVLISMLIAPIFKLTWSGLIDVVIILLLTYGLHRNSRASALLLLIYFIYAKIYFFYIEPIYALSGLVTGMIFIYFFIQGTIGTFQYHEIRKGEAPTQANPLSEFELAKKTRKIAVTWGISFASPFLIFSVFGSINEILNIRRNTPSDSIFGFVLSIGFLLYSMVMGLTSFSAVRSIQRNKFFTAGQSFVLSALGFIVLIGPLLTYKIISLIRTNMFSIQETVKNLPKIFLIFSIIFAVIFSNILILFYLVRWRVKRFARINPGPA